MTRWKWTAAVVLATLFLVFVVQNTGVVEVRFLAWHISMSRVILLPLTLAIGVALGYLLGKLR